MNLDHANEIIDLWCNKNKKIDAIKILRMESGMGLHQAKTYLDDHGRHADLLLRNLAKDFIKDPRDLLIEARAELMRLVMRIEQLELEIGEETVPDKLMDDIRDPSFSESYADAKTRVTDMVDTAKEKFKACFCNPPHVYAGCPEHGEYGKSQDPQ